MKIKEVPYQLSLENMFEDTLSWGIYQHNRNELEVLVPNFLSESPLKIAEFDAEEVDDYSAAMDNALAFMYEKAGYFIETASDAMFARLGIDLDKMRNDLMQQNPNIVDVKIIDSDCKTRVVYRDSAGEQRHEDMSNDIMTSMLLAGGIGALAGYVTGNSHTRDRYKQMYYTDNRKKRKSYGNSTYFSSNSRAIGAFKSNKTASRINVSSSTGKVTTRSNPFRGTSSVARSSSYSGG